jgi:hypothetical protein
MFWRAAARIRREEETQPRRRKIGKGKMKKVRGKWAEDDYNTSQRDTGICITEIGGDTTALILVAGRVAAVW